MKKCKKKILLGLMMYQVLGSLHSEASEFSSPITGNWATDRPNFGSIVNQVTSVNDLIYSFSLDDSLGVKGATGTKGVSVATGKKVVVSTTDPNSFVIKVEGIAQGSGRDFSIKDLDGVLNSGNLNFTEGAAISVSGQGGEVVGATSPVYGDARNFSGVNQKAGGSLTFGGATDISVTSLGGKATGTTTGSNTASASSYDTAGILNSGTLQFDGDAKVRVLSEGGIALGETNTLSISVNTMGISQTGAGAHSTFNQGLDLSMIAKAGKGESRQGTVTTSSSGNWGIASTGINSSLHVKGPLKVDLTFQGGDGTAKTTALSYLFNNAGIELTGAGSKMEFDQEADISVLFQGGTAVSNDVTGSARADLSTNNYGMTTGSGTQMKFGDQLTLAATGKGGVASSAAGALSNASSLLVGVRNGGSMELEQGAKILVSSYGGSATVGGNTKSALVDGTGTGIWNTSTSLLTIGDGLDIQVSAQGGTALAQEGALASALAKGTGVENEGTMDLKKGATISVSAIGGTGVVGVGIKSGIASASAIGLSNNGSLTLAGDLNIQVSAQGGEVSTVSGNADSSATAYGVYQRSGTMNLLGNVQIKAEALAGNATSSGTKLTSAESLAIRMNAGTLNINQAGDKNVQIVGDIGFAAQSSSGILNLRLNESGSYFQGLTTNSTSSGGQNNLTFENGGAWRPTGEGTVKSTFGTAGNGLTLGNGGVLDMAWWNNQEGEIASRANLNDRFRTLEITGKRSLQEGAIYRVNTDLSQMKSDQVIFKDNRPGSGSGTQYIQVAYDPLVANLSAGETLVFDLEEGQKIDVVKVGTGSGISDFEGMASLVYDPLKSYSLTHDVVYDSSLGVASITSITAQMKGLNPSLYTVSAQQSALLGVLRYQEKNQLTRLGDLRFDWAKSEGGAWAKVHGGQSKLDGAYGTRFTEDYSGIDFGVDKKQSTQSGDFYFGLLGRILDSSTDFTNGSSSLDGKGFGVYGTWLSKKGHYVDLVAQANRYHQSYSALDGAGALVDGDYHAWSYGVGATYGYRVDLPKNWFLEPQVGMNFGRIQGVDYGLTSGASIHQGGIDTQTGRVGLSFGKNFYQGEALKGNFFVRTDFTKDWSGHGQMSGSYQGNSVAIDTKALNENVFSLSLGGNLRLSKHWNGTAQVSKDFSGDISSNWRGNLEVRYSW